MVRKTSDRTAFYKNTVALDPQKQQQRQQHKHTHSELLDRNHSNDSTSNVHQPHDPSFGTILILLFPPSSNVPMICYQKEKNLEPMIASILTARRLIIINRYCKWATDPYKAIRTREPSIQKEFFSNTKPSRKNPKKKKKKPKTF